MKLTYDFYLGPNLPPGYGFGIWNASMVTSPTGKGVVLIGGNRLKNVYCSSNNLLELSGGSIESLKWNVLEQKLMNPREGHLSFSVPDTLNFK